ncbi:hypothetical protein HanRHA438_Chr09g0425241 [Helianthus annuus]|nr:hypothetical protein HanRHA438_Chr09g0425241 [Helianthus annuus]
MRMFHFDHWEARKRFDKADAVYSQELYSARMMFEQARFSLVRSLELDVKKK